MRKFLLPLLALIGAAFASCHYDGKCIDPEYYFLSFTPGDTAATVETFQKGTNFATRIDTFYTNDIFNGGETVVMLHRFRGTLIHTFDWKVSLIPSGKVVKVTDITLIDREERMPKSDNRRCGNDVSIKVNGTPYQSRTGTDVTSSVRFEIK